MSSDRYSVRRELRGLRVDKGQVNLFEPAYFVIGTLKSKLCHMIECKASTAQDKPELQSNPKCAGRCHATALSSDLLSGKVLFRRNVTQNQCHEI